MKRYPISRMVISATIVMIGLSAAMAAPDHVLTLKHDPQKSELFLR